MKTPLCPFLKKPCIEHECMMYTHVQMTDPQSGLTKDEWTCSLVLIPIMIIENARKTGGVQSAVESMRNEVVKRQDVLNAAIEERKHETPRIVDSNDGPRMLNGHGGER